MQPLYKTEFKRLFSEFAAAYPNTDSGQWHIAVYDKTREQGRRNFKALTAAADQGEDITDGVLLGLLPYSDTLSNQEKGAWIHYAPAITGDLQKWFENVGWTKPEDWSRIADAILTFVRRSATTPQELEAAVRWFSSLPYSKGFQTGMLTPILNALRPDHFVLINNKTRKVINFFAATSYQQALTDYPALNSTAWTLIDTLDDIIQHEGVNGLSTADNFDMFSHWLTAVSNYSFSIPEEVNEDDVDSAQAQSLFSVKTFELLAGLRDEPTKEYYNAHKSEIQQHIIEPIKELFQRVANELPGAITERMETQKGITAQILKNDYGRGGAYDYYWGAFYPKGSKRTADAQLFMTLIQEYMEFGFYIGEYGQEQRRRFAEHAKQYASELAPLLSDYFEAPIYLFSDQANEVIAPQVFEADSMLDWERWLQHPDGSEYRAAVKLPRERVLTTSTSQLVTQIVRTFEQLFPLVLLTVSDDPITEIAGYLKHTSIVIEEPAPFRAEGRNGDIRAINPIYTLETCAEETGLETTMLSRWVRAIKRKGQAILYGPPGTGKTFVAERLARHLIGGGDGFSEIVQFHPAYTYEDFILGIRPVTTDGGLLYLPVPGRFLDFSEQAGAHEDPCVLIIDEINRANLSKVFGELMYLLEYRNQTVPLAGGGTLRIPANVYIIGTMNTADRSIALVDHALRRRFAFLPLYPDYSVLEKYHAETGFPVEGLISTLRSLNTQIADRHYEVGISFFWRMI